MKGPSLEAIRKFKAKQEQKKLEEEEKKKQDKLAAIKFRAAQGDRKAKHVLNKFQKVENDFERKKAQQEPQQSQKNLFKRCELSTASQTLVRSSKKRVVTDFEELMKIAQTNKNQVKKPNHIKDNCSQPNKLAKISLKHSSSGKSNLIPISSQQKPRCNPQPQKHAHAHYQPKPKPSLRYKYNEGYDDEEEEDEDEYELDGFVVDEGEDEAQQELKKTLKNMFGYDKRKYDLREMALDNEYHRIGNVSTFEDLEREERRSARLAAAEDSLALKEEEERKRIKKMRKKGLL